MTNFGQWLRARRLERDLTQAELAGKVGVDLASIKAMEQRTEPPQTRGHLERLEHVLDVTYGQPG